MNIIIFQLNEYYIENRQYTYLHVFRVYTQIITYSRIKTIKRKTNVFQASVTNIQLTGYFIKLTFQYIISIKTSCTIKKELV